MTRRRAGGSVLLLLTVLLALLGAGAFNYHRNWKAEREAPRPYAGYSDADLAALIGAYQEELRTLEGRVPGSSGSAGAGGGALLGEQVKAFERARAAGDAQRRALGDVAQREAVLADLRREEALRAELGAGMQAHLRRLLTF